MDDRDIVQYFIKHLADSDNPDDLIMHICERSGRSWNNVEALLNRVREEREQEIVRRQSPLLTLLALVTFTAGFILMIFFTYFLIDIVKEISRAYSSPVDVFDLLQAVFASGYISIGGVFLGFAMVLGSLLGMRDVWAAILKI